jgi:hypothetical protein
MQFLNGKVSGSSETEERKSCAPSYLVTLCSAGTSGNSGLSVYLHWDVKLGLQYSSYGLLQNSLVGWLNMIPNYQLVLGVQGP